MATLTQIRDDLATRLAAIPDLNCYSKVTDSIEEPAAVVGMPDPLEYNMTYGPTGGAYTIPVRLYVTRFDAEAGQEILDTYIAPTGTSSVKRAIEDTDVAITSGWHVAVVTRVSEFANYKIGDVVYLGCEFQVEVVAT